MNTANENERSEIEDLLPWHAAGTLSARDTQSVEARKILRSDDGGGDAGSGDQRDGGARAQFRSLGHGGKSFRRHQACRRLSRSVVATGSAAVATALSNRSVAKLQTLIVTSQDQLRVSPRPLGNVKFLGPSRPQYHVSRENFFEAARSIANCDLFHICDFGLLLAEIERSRTRRQLNYFLSRATFIVGADKHAPHFHVAILIVIDEQKRARTDARFPTNTSALAGALRTAIAFPFNTMSFRSYEGPKTYDCVILAVSGGRNAAFDLVKIV